MARASDDKREAALRSGERRRERARTRARLHLGFCERSEQREKRIKHGPRKARPVLDSLFSDVYFARLHNDAPSQCVVAHSCTVSAEHVFSAPVAQLDRASDYGSEGWRFESFRARRRTTR